MPKPVRIPCSKNPKGAAFSGLSLLAGKADVALFVTCSINLVSPETINLAKMFDSAVDRMYVALASVNCSIEYRDEAETGYPSGAAGPTNNPIGT